MRWEKLWEQGNTRLHSHYPMMRSKYGTVSENSRQCQETFPTVEFEPSVKNWAQPNLPSLFKSRISVTQTPALIELIKVPPRPNSLQALIHQLDANNFDKRFNVKARFESVLTKAPRSILDSDPVQLIYHPTYLSTYYEVLNVPLTRDRFGKCKRLWGVFVIQRKGLIASPIWKCKVSLPR